MKELPLNKHMRPAKALFRLGIDMLRRVLKNECSKNDPIDFQSLLLVLSRTQADDSIIREQDQLAKMTPPNVLTCEASSRFCSYRLCCTDYICKAYHPCGRVGDYSEYLVA